MYEFLIDVLIDRIDHAGADPGFRKGGLAPERAIVRAYLPTV